MKEIKLPKILPGMAVITAKSGINNAPARVKKTMSNRETMYQHISRSLVANKTWGTKVLFRTSIITNTS